MLWIFTSFSCYSNYFLFTCSNDEANEIWKSHPKTKPKGRRQKKKNKKHGFLHVLYFDPPAPPKHGLFFFFWSEPPPNYPTPSQMGKNFFAFLDVSDHLEAIKKNKNKHGF